MRTETAQNAAQKQVTSAWRRSRTDAAFWRLPLLAGACVRFASAVRTVPRRARREMRSLHRVFLLARAQQQRLFPSFRVRIERGTSLSSQQCSVSRSAVLPFFSIIFSTCSINLFRCFAAPQQHFVVRLRSEKMLSASCMGNLCSIFNFSAANGARKEKKSSWNLGRKNAIKLSASSRGGGTQKKRKMMNNLCLIQFLHRRSCE